MTDRRAYGPDPQTYLQRKVTFQHLASTDPATIKALRLGIEAAHSPDPALITGEPGTGKLSLALAIHHDSPCTAFPFVRVPLGANAARLERDTAAARGGTLYIAEVLALQEDAQRLLGDMLRGEVQATHAVRFVVGSSIGIFELDSVPGKGFSAVDIVGLYEKHAIHLPPLRERGDDRLILFQAFLEDAAKPLGRVLAGWTDDVSRFVLEHDWPGNLTEMRWTTERAVQLAKGATVTLADIRGERPDVPADFPAGAQDILPVSQLKQAYMMHALRLLGNNVKAAATALEVSEMTLYRAMEQEMAPKNASKTKGK